MEGKYRNKYRVSSARLEGWDYGSHGLYFVTICTKDRIRYFGEIEDPTESETQKSSGQRSESGTQSIASLRMTEIGKIANQYWTDVHEC